MSPLGSAAASGAISTLAARLVSRLAVICLRGSSGKVLSPVDLRMSRPGRTPCAMPAHDPAEGRMRLLVCVGTYPALVAEPCQGSRSRSELFLCLRMIFGCSHFGFLPSPTVDVAGRRKDTPRWGNTENRSRSTPGKPASLGRCAGGRSATGSTIFSSLNPLKRLFMAIRACGSVLVGLRETCVRLVLRTFRRRQVGERPGGMGEGRNGQATPS